MQVEQTTETPVDEQALDPEKEKFISGALAAVMAREQEFTTGWWKEAEAADKIYTTDSSTKNDDSPYNILYSNTEVLLPSLYSATPKPDVRGRYRGQMVKPIPEILDRFLTVAADTSNPGGDTLDHALQDAVLSSLVPGMGYVRLRYVEKSFPISFESGHYKTLIWGKASRWSKIPWIAFKHTMKREQMYEQFKIPKEDQMGYIPSSEAEDDKDNCDVFEFWDKRTRKVYFLCEQWHKKLLLESDDPLGLENFFPTPGLLMMTVRNGKYTPIPLYNYYRNQAEELNRVSVRLNRVLSAIRVKGVYNNLLGEDLKKLLSTDGGDNELIGAAEAGLLAQSGGFDKHIWLLPIEKLIEVAAQLYKAREAIKQVIYEITGISDIIRGSSVASETATAQDLKNKWGTVRLRRMQTVVANYARDLFRMTVDCGSEKIPPETWKQITQMLDIPTEQEQAVAKQQLQYLQQVAAQQAAFTPPPQPPMPGQPPTPQPPGPPPPDPKLIAQAQSPTWEKLLAKIKSDLSRTFTVNIETSSTIDLDTAQDKSEVNEFMASMGQLLPGLQGFAALGPTGLEAAKEILKQVCLRYKFGIEIADVIGHIQAPPPPQPEPPKGPPPPSPEELQADKMEQAARMQKIQGEMQINAAELQLKLAEIDAAKTKLGLEIQEANLRLEGTRAKMRAQEASAILALKQKAVSPTPAASNK